MESEEPCEKRIKVEFVELEDICTAEDAETVDVEGGGGEHKKSPSIWSRNITPSTLPSRVDPTSSSDLNASMLIDFKGPCNFGYYFRKNNSSQMVNYWLYSELLNQVFLRMGNVVHIQFTVDESKAPNPDDLFIRATPVFCSSDHVHLPVNRCTLHSLDDDPLNEAHKDGICRCDEYNHVGHIIRSTSANAIYCFDPATERHSVLVPIKHKLYDLLYSFACKSSCSRGMERRPMRTVFTLETGAGLILGRSSLNTKICSCPKRDKDRGEKEFLASSRRPKREHVQGASQAVVARNGHFMDGESPLVESSEQLEKHINGNKTDDRITKLKTELLQVQNLVKRLNQLCSSIEKTLDSLDSDI